MRGIDDQCIGITLDLQDIVNLIFKSFPVNEKYRAAFRLPYRFLVYFYDIGLSKQLRINEHIFQVVELSIRKYCHLSRGQSDAKSPPNREYASRPQKNRDDKCDQGKQSGNAAKDAKEWVAEKFD
jgi:hypothetical protein